MAAKIEYQRHKDKTASIADLLAHDKYLNNASHLDHAGYTMLPGKNYNCVGSTIDDLVAGVELAHANHIRRKNLLKHRRRTSQLWGEAIYALDDGAYATAKERNKIEREYINRFFPDAACRATWHVNEETGACDLHIVFAHKRPCGKLTLERTKVKMEKRLQALDRYAADLLNNNPDKPANRIPDIRTAEAVAEADAQKYSEIREEKEAAELAEADAKNPAKKAAKKSPPKKKSTAQCRWLAAQVARKAAEEGIDDVDAHHLPGLIRRLKIKIIKIIGSIIQYASSRKTRKGKTSDGEVRKPRIRTVYIHDFLYDVLHAQIDLRIERVREMADLTDAQPEPVVEPTAEFAETPKTPKSPVEIGETQQPKAKKTIAEKTAIKAATLEAYLNVNLGRIKVDSKKRKSLTEATKGMLKSDRTIEPKLLKSFTDEQRQILVTLAAAYAMEMD